MNCISCPFSFSIFNLAAAHLWCHKGHCWLCHLLKVSDNAPSRYLLHHRKLPFFRLNILKVQQSLGSGRRHKPGKQASETINIRLTVPVTVTSVWWDITLLTSPTNSSCVSMTPRTAIKPKYHNKNCSWKCKLWKTKRFVRVFFQMYRCKGIS